jgi:hypothetical protein
MLYRVIKGVFMTSDERKAGRYQRRKAERDRKRDEKLSRFDDFSLVTDPNNLYKAFRSSRKGVSWKESTQRYEMNLFANILESKRRLEAGESVQSGFVEFTLHERGKIRHIKSVHISERVIQKALCNEVLVPILTNSLIHDNGASIKGKGVHFSLKRLIAHLSKFYRQNDYSNNGYVLLIDFSKYFDSIRHDILMKLVEKRVHNEKVLELAHRFIEVFGPGVSLGLGSQVSQVFAIYHTNDLDHAIKEKMKIKIYGRYMDDIYLVHRDKDYLEKCLAEIKIICDTLGIAVNEKKTRIFPLRKGMLFLKGKYYLLENGRVLKKSTKESAKRMRRKLRKFRKLIDEGKMNYQDLRTAYQSWRGNYLKRFHAYKTVQNMDSMYDTLFINNNR